MKILDRAARAWKRRLLATHLTLVFGATVLAAMLSMVFYVNYQAVGIVQDASSTLFDHTVSQSRSEIDKSVNGVDTMLRLFAADPQAEDFQGATQQGFIQRLSLMFKVSPLVSAAYIGFDDGGFVLLRQLTSPIARRNIGAPAEASYFLEIVRAGAQGAKMEVSFLDAGLRRVAGQATQEQAYDPRARTWYRAALASNDTILTDPYWFFLTQERGVTIARPLQSGRGVVGIDLGLADLSQALRQMKSTPSSILTIVNANGETLAGSEPINAPDAAPQAGAASLPAGRPGIASAMLDGVAGDQSQSRTIEAQGRTWITRVASLHSGPWTFRLVMATPVDEMLAGARKLVSTLVWLGIALAVAMLAVILAVARAVSRPLSQLAREAERIERFQFQQAPSSSHSSVREVQALSHAIGKAGYTIQRFIEIGRALAAEHDPARLMRRLLQETLGISEAEGGLILLSENDGDALSIVAREVAADSRHRPVDPPRLLDLREVDAQILQALESKSTAYFDRASMALQPLLSGLTGQAPLAPDQVFRFLVIPLLNSSEDVVGGLVLATRIRADAPMSDDSLDLMRALSGTAAIAIETLQLLKARKTLLDAVIRMIARSIDAKSPYTSGHCQRVPVLTMSLARAASESHEHPFADFSLSSEEWEAVEVAGWLHDCGKLTTPEYVVDKATKLETLYNRLHEIRMRFELLKACAHTGYWRGVAQGGDPLALAELRDAELAALDADFAFVAASNEGGENMPAQDVERLAAIGRRTWVRTLDDRIGISRDEKMRKSRVPAPALPVEEKLLDDRPDHFIEHHDSRLSEMESGVAFRMRPLEHRMNLGELYNLSIGRGTLTDEERYEINRHITRTIVMLQDLPLTGALRLVPEFAGGHHEKMDGTGYPRGLVREDMSIVARIMAIADVFEALTSSDRPYKKAKTLSEAVRIMGFMKRDRHLDPDLLDLFLRSGVWREYAQTFLDPDQIDEPDIDAVLAVKV